MADKDYNIIKPVGGLQNIAGLTPTRRREQRKRRHDLHKENNEESEQELNGSIADKAVSSELTEDEEDQHSIDYCA